jgi:hypothetical protein
MELIDLLTAGVDVLIDHAEDRRLHEERQAKEDPVLGELVPAPPERSAETGQA